MDISPWEMLENDPIIKICIEQKLRLVAPLYAKKKALNAIFHHIISMKGPCMFAEPHGVPMDITAILKELLADKAPEFLEYIYFEKDLYDSIESTDRKIIEILQGGDATL